VLDRIDAAVAGHDPELAALHHPEFGRAAEDDPRRVGRQVPFIGPLGRGLPIAGDALRLVRDR